MTLINPQTLVIVYFGPDQTNGYFFYAFSIFVDTKTLENAAKIQEFGKRF